jgi:hypothetical protein
MTDPNMTEQQLLDKVTSTFETLDEWRRLLTRYADPLPGSDAALDDAGWRWAPPTSLARNGLGAAVDHLHAVRVLMDARQMFPMAQSTLIRAAILGASQAVWILAPPSSAERVANGRNLAYQNYRQQLVFGRQAMRDLPPEALLPEAASGRAHLEMRISELEGVIQADGSRPAPPNATRIIELAARETFATQSAPEVFVTEAVLAWRATSGTAHALPWPLLGQPDTTIGDVEPDGMTQHVAAGGIHRIASSYMCAFWITVKGWELMSARTSRPLWTQRRSRFPL